ncbi:MAG: hypothetical protein ACREBI_11495 [Nitrosotalea sp.]
MITSRKKIILTVTLASVISVLVFYYLYPFYTQSNMASEIVGVDTLSCGAVTDASTFVDAKGFTSIKKIYKGSLPFYDFTLKPGDSGIIVMDYKFSTRDICQGNLCHPSNLTQYVLSNTFLNTTFAKFFNKELDIQKVNSTYPLVPYTSEEIKLTLNAENLTNSIVRITYGISVDPNTPKGDYLLDLINTCPGQLLTIGERPYNGPLPWDNGRIS